MSIKRSKQRGHGAGWRTGDDVDFVSFNDRSGEPEKTWEEYVTDRLQEEFIPYSLQAHFERGALIDHAKFGKGVVLKVEGKRIDVLFSEGPKKLGHAEV